MIFKKKHDDEKALLCIELGTSSIKSCIITHHNDVMELKGQSVVAQQFGSIQAGALVHLASIIKNVQEAVKKAENMAKQSPFDVVMGISGDSIKGSTVTISSIRSKSEKILDDQEFKTIIHEVQWQAFDHVRRTVSDDLCVQESDLKLLNASIVKIKMDGNLITDPRGMTGKKLEFEMFHCFAPREHFGHIHTIAAELGFHELKGVFIPSFSVAYSISLSPLINNAIVIDIGAGATDICVLHEGKILENRSFSLGGNTFTKRISHELSTSFEEAEEIKLSFSEEQLEKKSQKIIEEALQPDLDIWMTSLHFCLQELPMKKLPQKIFLCGQGSLLKAIPELLRRYDWVHHFPCEGTMEVRHLDYTDITTSDAIGSQFDPIYLPLIAVGTTAYDFIYANRNVDEVLRMVIGDKI